MMGLENMEVICWRLMPQPHVPGTLLRRGLELSMLQWVVRSINNVPKDVPFHLVRYIVPTCSDDQLLSLFTLSVREQQWQTVSSFLRHGMGDEQRRWAVEESLQHATPENDEETSGVILYCKDDQLSVVLELSMLQWVVRSINNVPKDVPFHLVRYIVPTCSDDQLLSLFTLSVREQQWQTVSSFLRHGMGDEQRRWAVEESLQHATPENDEETSGVILYCKDDQLSVVLEEAVRRRLWRTVENLLGRTVGDDVNRQRRWAVNGALQHASPENDYYIKHVIAHCSDDQLGVVMEEAVRRHLWETVRKLLDRPVDDALVRQAIEESYRSVSGEPLTDYTLPACRDDQRRDFVLIDAVRRDVWYDRKISLLELVVPSLVGEHFTPCDSVGMLLKHGVHDTLRRWAVKEGSRHADDDCLVQHILPYCADDQLNSLLKQAIIRKQWRAVDYLLQRGVHDTLRRLAVKFGSSFATDHDLVEHILPHCADDQLDYLFTRAYRRRQWRSMDYLLQRGVHTRCKLVCKAPNSFTDDDLVNYILPHCADDQLDSLLTQTVPLKRWRVVDYLLQRNVEDASHRWAIVEACKHADESALIQYILPHIDKNPPGVSYYLQPTQGVSLADSSQHTGNAKSADNPQDTEDARSADSPQHTGNARSADNPQYTGDARSSAKAGEGTGGSWREHHICPRLTVDLLHLMLGEAVRRKLWEVCSQCPETERHAGRDCPHTATYGHAMKHFLQQVTKDRSNELLFYLLTTSLKRKLKDVIKVIRDHTDRRQTLSDIVCGTVAAMTPFSVDNTHLSNLINFYEDSHLHTLANVYLDIIHFVVCPELDRARNHSTKKLQRVVSAWEQQLAELYVNTKYNTGTEQALVYLFFCLCRSVDLTDESNELLCVILSTIPLLPSLQSVAVGLMLRAKRWDVINNAVLCRVWEDVRRSVLRAAVEQKEWATVQHMADHSLYDDERNWALMQAYYENRWDVVLALADFGHNANQRKRIYRQVAKHGDGKTVLELFKRGADVRTVREQLETANPSRERPPSQETTAQYQNRLSWLAWLEGKIEYTADNLQRAVQRNKWPAVLHRVRCEPSTLSLALDAAIEKVAWHVVVQLVRLGMDVDQRDSLFPEVIRRRQWAVGRALLEGGYFDDSQHGVSVELRRAALPQLLNVGQWILVARVMEHGVDDEKRRQVIWEALDRREGSVVAHIISIMEGRVSVEERERVFQQAIRQGVWQALKRLVEEKDSTGITHRDLTLPAAAKHHQWDVLTHCLQHGADVNKRDAAGDTMLHMAAREEDWEGVKGLLLHGLANQHLLDSQGYSVLHTAVDNVDWDAVQMLVEFQCDVNQPDPDGDTPLQRMIECGLGEVIKSAMFWGSNVTQAVTEGGMTALHALCADKVLDTMHIVVARGGDPLAVNSRGITVLRLAVKNKELLAECIQLGISTHQPHITDHLTELADEGLTKYSVEFCDAALSPMYDAICNCDKVITEMLYESGSCSNRELHNIAHKWFDPNSYTAHLFYRRHDLPTIPNDQAAYVSTIVNTPRRLESMCRLVISHNIGVCKPKRRRDRVMTLQLPSWFSHLYDYIMGCRVFMEK